MSTIQVLPAIADNLMALFPRAIERAHTYQHQVIAPTVPRLQAYMVGEIAAGWIITQPLPINLEQDGDHSYIVSDDFFLVYGEGDTQSDAIHDYVESLIKFYQLLSASAINNPFDQPQLESLQSYLKETA